MTTSDFQMTLDAIPVHTKVTGELPQGPAIGIQDREQYVVFIAEFGLHSSPHIDRCGDWLDVLGVDATTNPTQVICLQPFGPRSDPFFPDCTMSSHPLSIETSLPVVVVPSSSSLPYPARRQVSPVFDAEIPFVNESHSQRHIDTPYQVLQLRVELDGYEESL